MKRVALVFVLAAALAPATSRECRFSFEGVSKLQHAPITMVAANDLNADW
jgi:hypothetical protein